MNVNWINKNKTKILSGILSIILAVGMFPIAPISADSSTNYLAITSDVHDRTSDFQTWLTNLKSSAPSLDHMVFGGDYTYTNDWTVAGTCKTEATTAYSNVPVVLARGNHDVNDTTRTYDSGLVYNGTDYAIYALDISASGQTIAPVSPDTLNNVLAGIDAAKPVFVVSHYPLHYLSSIRTTTNAAAYVETLNKYPNAIFLWAHNHSQNDPEYGKVKIPGDMLQTTSSAASSVAINFTYANMGSLYSGNNGAYGLLATLTTGVSETTIDFEYKNLTGGTASEYSVILDNGGTSAAETPNIDTQPQNAEVAVNEPVNLSVTAHVADGGTLSYQWYSNTTASNSNGTIIADAASSTYAAPTGVYGDYYYYCVITNTKDGELSSITSSAATVTVNDVVGDITYIHNAAIADIIPPAAGGMPDTSASVPTTGVFIQGSVTWSPDTVSFGYNTVYTANVTLTADEGYAFAESPSVTVNTHPVTSAVLNPDGTLTVTFTFPGTGDYQNFIAITSDLHDKTDDLQTWMNNLKSSAATLDYMIFGGDYTYTNDWTQVTEASTIATTAFVGVPVALARGNHDIDDTTGTYSSGLVYNGTDYAIYVLDAGTWDLTSQTITTDPDALDTALAAIPASKSVFVVSHYPLHYLNNSTGTRTTTNAAAFITVLNKYPNAIVLWAHNHSQNDAAYGTVKKSGDTIQPSNSAASAVTINFTYANMGAIYSGNNGAYGLLATLTKGENETTIDFAYKNLAGETASEYSVILDNDTSDAETPVITAQPSDVSADVNGPATLSVTAHVNDGGTISYQWYSNDEDSNTGGTVIPLATAAAYPAPTASIGTVYYYCVVTNTNNDAQGDKTAVIASSAASVTVSTMDVWDGSVATGFGGGTGSSEDPYLISTGAQLAFLAQEVNAGSSYSGKFFKQTADINLNSQPWTPIGVYVSSDSLKRPFCGTYDGDGYIVSNLRIDVSIDNTAEVNKSYGLFSYINTTDGSSGTLQNMGLTNVFVHVATQSDTTGNAYAAGLCGYVGVSGKSGYIYNCYVEGETNAETHSTSARCAAGGLAGFLIAGSITNSYAAVTATIGGSSGSTGGAGGVAGYKDTNASFSNSYWNSDLTSKGSSSTSGLTAMTTSELKDGAFAALLNKNCSPYKKWMSDSILNLNSGYPIHSRPVAVDNAEMPAIIDQPDDTAASLHTSAVLSIAASVSQGDLSYQWYRNTFKSNTGGLKINGATGTSYAASTAALGSSYFYCVVTNFDSLATVQQTVRIESAAVEVTVGNTPDAWDGTTMTAITIGSGTESDPYQVWTGANLAWMADQVNNPNPASQTVFDGKYFKQMADIDLGSHAWTPIGKYVGSGSSSNQRFGGIYDGNSHIITNLYVNITVPSDTSSNKAYALFGILYGTVKNLGIVGASVSVTNSGTGTSGSLLAYAGGIAGYVGTSGSSPTGYIYNSYVTGTIQATGSSTSAACCAGSLAGYLARSGIENCYGAAACTISGSYSSSTSGAGGIAGRKNSSSSATTYTNCCWDSTLTSYPINSSTDNVTGCTGYNTTACKDGTLLTLLIANHGSYLNWTADTTPNINGGYPIHVRATITDAAAPVINIQPAGRTVMQNEPVELTVQATGSGALYYQWYSNTVESTVGSAEIPLATTNSITPSTGAVGTMFYYCIVTNYDNDATGCQYADLVSNIAGVTVNASLIDAEPPNITGQPADQTVNVDESASLAVTAGVSRGVLSYQWYRNNIDSSTGGTLINLATANTYSAPTATAGTTYYYCVVTNLDSLATGNQTAAVTSNTAKVVVMALTNAAVPVITGQPADQTVNEGESVILTVTAGVSQGVLSYQWYRNDTDSSTGGTLISLATADTYSAPTATAGTTYYYCVVTNLDSLATGIKTAAVTSNTAMVAVNPILYGDTDQDGDVDVFDMLAIERHIWDVQKLTGTALIAADMDKDGDINIFDMVSIERYIWR